jgi:hypothetical protein
MAGITLGFGPANVGVDLGGIFGGGAPSVSQTLTGIVDAAEGALQDNLNRFQAGVIASAPAVQRAWAILNQMGVELARYGAEGQKALAERDRRVDPARLRWDWISYYIEPLTGGAIGSAGSGGAPTTSITGVPGAGAGVGGVTQAGLGFGSIPDWALVLAAVAGLLYLSKK